MSSNKRASQVYNHNLISTSDRGRLLLMMYDGGLKFLRLAKEGLEKKDIPKFARFLSKGQAIIAELVNTLDYEKGGQVAQELERLYDFMIYYLTEANIQKDAEKVGKVIELLEIVAGAFRSIIEGQKDNLEELVSEASRSAAQIAKPEYKPLRTSI